MRHIIYLSLFLIMFQIAVAISPAARADCYLISKDQTRREGVIVYNKDYEVLQACVDGKWKALGKVNVDLNPPCGAIKQPGCLHHDGTIYAGLSPDGNIPMYTTRCTPGRNWSGTACTGVRMTLPFNYGNATGNAPIAINSPFDGGSNTQTLSTLDADHDTPGLQPFLAATYCHTLEMNGHTDWYLPSIYELGILFSNKTAIRGFYPTIHHSSSVGGAGDSNSMIRFEKGETGAPAYNVWRYPRDFRCVRKAAE